MYVTEQERIDSLTMRIERTDVKGSGFIQFPPQRPFQQPIEMQPPTMAHQAHPEFYRAPANGLSAPRPSYHQGGSAGMRPQMAGSGIRPHPGSNGARPQMGAPSRPGAPQPGYVPPHKQPAQPGYVPPHTQSQGNYAPRPAPSSAPSNGRDYVRPSPSGSSNQSRPTGTYMRPPQPTANGHARPSYSNAAPAAYGSRGAMTRPPSQGRPPMQGRPPSRDAPSASYSAPPGRPQAPATAPTPQPVPVPQPAAVAAPVTVSDNDESGPAKAESGGIMSKSQLKRLRKKKREGAA